MTINMLDINNQMTTTELRIFQRMCTKNGKLLVIAMDQRNSMRRLIWENENSNQKISNNELGIVKSRLVKYLGNYSPAILLDSECALPDIIDSGILDRNVSLIVGMDASGYDEEDGGFRKSRIIDGMNAKKVRSLGGNTGKMLVYMRPDVGGDNFSQNLIRGLVEDFRLHGLLLIIEIIVYKLHNESMETFEKKKPQLIFESAHLAKQNGANFLKLQYPGSGSSCAKISEMLDGIPWAILSQGVDHDIFIEQLQTSLNNGSIGAIAGRTLWKDCVFLNENEMKENLLTKAVPRLNQLLAVVENK